MENKTRRQLLCDICKVKIRKLEATYQKSRRLKIKEKSGQEKRKVVIKIK